MDDDQQFCLRWNNHQSTLISVFDTLLENGTLVDCTLAAEGKFLKAHKVVLSACSPYFATLLSQQYDKHPIFILKDVKFQELRAMMDYMYRGEVNISQDQLAALLKAAESLQIKGLSDSRSAGSGLGGAGGLGAGQKPPTVDHKPLSVPVASGPLKGSSPSGYTIEQKRPRHIIGGPSSIDSQCGSREGSSSPTSRKRKKLRRRSMDNLNVDNHEHSNSSSQSMQINSSVTPSNTSTAITSVSSAVTAASQAAIVAAQQAAASGAVAGASGASGGVGGASGVVGAAVTKKTDNVSTNAKLEANVEHEMDNENGDEHDDGVKTATAIRKEQNKRKQHVDTDGGKDGSGGELLIEPKSEYEEGNDETVEDLTLDDEELLEDLEQAGPSHGGGEGSSQGYAQWQVDRSQDDVFMAAQEAAGQQRDPQGTTAPSTNNPTQYARIRVKNWLMMTDRAGIDKDNDTNHVTTTANDEENDPANILNALNHDENHEIIGGGELSGGMGNDICEANINMADGNDDNGSDIAAVTVKIERNSPSPSTNTAQESTQSDGNIDYNYDIKISSPISWAFEPIKTEKSLISDVTTTVYAAVKKSRKSSLNSPTLGIRSKPIRVLQSQSANQSTNNNGGEGSAADKKYRILFQNSRIRKESLEHSDDMIYNADYEKPWICRNCNRNYKWKNSLKCHLKNECGLPPRYFCNKMCGYRTNVHSNLKRHLNTKCRSKDD